MTRLDETLAWYEVVRASWALADRVVREYPEAVPEGSPFRNQATYEAVRLLESSAAEIDDLTVLALTSFFEELVLEYVAEQAGRLGTGQAGSALALVSYAFRDVERWPFVSVLGFFRTTVDPSLLDQVINVYKCRNWVAHGKKTQRPVLTDPIKAHRAITSFLVAAKILGTDVDVKPDPVQVCGSQALGTVHGGLVSDAKLREPAGRNAGVQDVLHRLHLPLKWPLEGAGLEALAGHGCVAGTSTREPLKLTDVEIMMVAWKP